MKKHLPLIVLFLLCFAPVAFSQVADSLKTEPFNAQAATEHYLNTLSGEARAKSDAYFEGGYWLLFWNILYTAGIAFVFLRLGLGRVIKNIALRVKNINLQNFIYCVLYFLLSWLLLFPLSVYEGFFREHQYALSNQSFGEWLKEDLTGLGVGVVIGSILLVVVYMAMRRMGKNWWIWGAGIAMVFAAFLQFIFPVFISPLFNDYKPLAEGTLKSEILSMARANGIPADNVYQFDASKQSNRVSANVSGFASTTRISLNDNLLKRCNAAEIKSVMGHEMGHYVLNHIYKGMIEFGVLLVIFFAVVNWAFQKTTGRWGAKIGVTDISDIGGLPLLIVLFSAAFFVLTPVTNTMIRTQEMEADMYGLNAAREPDAEAHVDMMLSEYRKIDPGYWEEIIFYDHPSGRRRVFAAMRWKAENLK